MNTRNILIKVYANIYPANEDLYHALASELSGIYSVDNSENKVVEIDNDLILISFEGIYFPIEEVINRIKDFLTTSTQGKVDYIDMEEWTLTRYTIKDKGISAKSNSLNAVMDYSRNY